jgi:hypothetical protein
MAGAPDQGARLILVSLSWGTGVSSFQIMKITFLTLPAMEWTGSFAMVPPPESSFLVYSVHSHDYFLLEILQCCSSYSNL